MKKATIACERCDGQGEINLVISAGNHKTVKCDVCCGKKRQTAKWKITGTQIAPMPYNSKGTELTFYLEKMPEASQPTVFVSAYCSSKADASFVEKTAKEIERLLNV